MEDGELFVIHAQQVEDGGVKIVAVGGVHGGFVAPVVALAVADAGADAGAPEPGDEGAAVVIAAGAALSEWCAAEFRRPVDVGVVVGLGTFVAPGGGAVAVLVVVVLVVVAGVVGVVATTPPQSAGRLTAMVRETEPPPGTARVMVTVNDASDIGSPVAVPSILPCSKEPITCPVVMLDNVRPFETVSPVTVAGPG